MTMRTMSDLIPAHLASMRAAGMSARTIGDRERVLSTADRDLPLGIEVATEDELAEWLGRDDWSASTRATYFHHLRGLYRWAYARALLDLDPMAEMPVPPSPVGRPRPVRPDVLADVLARAADPWRTFVILAAFAGLRCCEIAGLHREDITERQIYIRIAKGGNPEIAHSHPLVWSTVRDFPRGLVAEHVGGRACERWISIRGALYFRRDLDLPGVSLHRFRHTFGTELRRAGHDLFKIQKCMRHKTVKSTQIYVDVADEECEMAVAALPVPTLAAS